MRRLLWIGDAACKSGFARVTHNVLDVLRETWDVSVLGINYRGDPHEFPYPIYPALPGGDVLGWKRVEKLLPVVKPDVVVILNDPWNFRGYLQHIPVDLPTIGVVAVDGLHCRGDLLNGLSKAIFWTEFGQSEAHEGQYTGPSTVIPLGVDTTFWRPGDRQAARAYLFKKKNRQPYDTKPDDFEELRDAYIVLNINRNQSRKRLDLTIRYFALWTKQYKVPDAYLYLHISPTGDVDGFDCEALASYYGVLDHLIIADAGVWNGVSDETMRSIYASANVMMSTTQGEGWGLPTMEGMACGIPQILPQWSALGEWASPAASMIPCSTTLAQIRGSVIGGIADEDIFIDALHAFYLNPKLRANYSDRGREHVSQSRYSWRAIGERYNEEIETVLSKEEVA